MITHNHEYIYQSIKGIRKKDNEDNYLAIENEQYEIYAIFDGVGSAQNGKKATDLAKDFIVVNHADYLSTQICVDKLMYDCNNYILNTQLHEPFTTYCIVVIPQKSPQEVIYSYMGDSRIYLLTKQFIEQITTDDKLQLANVVTKCLGMNTLENYDFYQNSINITDENLLLCTDGFYAFLEENRMQFFEILNKKNIHSIKKEVTSLIVNRNNDDATFLLIK